MPNNCFWDVHPRRFVLVSCAFIAGTALAVYHIEAHWILILCIAITALLEYSAFTYKAIICVLIALISGVANTSLREPAAPVSPWIFNSKTDLKPGLNRDSERWTQQKSRLNQLPHEGAFKPHRETREAGENDVPFISDLNHWAEKNRKQIVQFHQRANGPEIGSLLASMVLGDRAVHLKRKLKKDFRASGLSHVLAASGFNLSIVGGSVFVFCRLCGFANTAKCLLSLSAMSLFVLLAGPSPSVLRAFLMGCMILLAKSSFRSIHLPAVLSLACVAMIAFDPALIADIGFQLSFASTAGMISSSTSLSKLMKPSFFLLPAWAISAIASTMVAQAYVMPLQIFYFKQWNLYFLLANLVTAPLIPAITIAGFAASVLFICENQFTAQFALATFCAQLCSLPVRLLLFIVTQIANLPFAVLDTSATNTSILLINYSCLLCFPHLQRGARVILFVSYLISLLIMLRR